MAEQGCLLSSCAGDPGAEGSNPSLSAARPRAVVNRSPSRRPVTAGLRFGLAGVEIEAPFAVDRQEGFLYGEVPRNPEFGSTSAFAGSRSEARPGFRFVC